MHRMRHKAATLPHFALLFAIATTRVCGQGKPQAPQPQLTVAETARQASPTTQPLELSLAKAIELARANNAVYNSAVTEAGLVREDRTQARDAHLPQVTYNNQYLYTQPNELGQVRFIANNAVHEYVSQGDVHESIDVAAVAVYRRTAAAAAAARARAEIASRGLVVTVVQSYFAVIAAENKLDAARRATDEGDRFLQLTQQLERGGEVAHSDTIKAELQAQDRRRQLQEAQLAVLNARLDLAVLIFPNFQDNFVLTESLAASTPLPTLEEVQQQAAGTNTIPQLLAGEEKADHPERSPS